jgi:hypothetical protein
MKSENFAMNDRVCPLNKRPCRCDPDAEEVKFRPCMLTKRIGKLQRLLLGSTSDHEVNNAIYRLRDVLASEGLHPNDVAVLIENYDASEGKIEEKQFRFQDMQESFTRGIERGIERGRAEQQAPPEYYDADDFPRWHEIALFCNRDPARLRDDREREFVNDMTTRLMFRQPTEKQGKWLFTIFLRLGGPRSRTVRFHW